MTGIDRDPFVRMRIHEVEIRVAAQNAEVDVGSVLREPAEHRQRVHGVATPVFDEHEEMPRPAKRRRACESRVVNMRAPIHRTPQFRVGHRVRQEVGERLPRAEALLQCARIRTAGDGWRQDRRRRHGARLADTR